MLIAIVGDGIISLTLALELSRKRLQNGAPVTIHIYGRERSQHASSSQAGALIGCHDADGSLSEGLMQLSHALHLRKGADHGQQYDFMPSVDCYDYEGARNMLEMLGNTALRQTEGVRSTPPHSLLNPAKLMSHLRKEVEKNDSIVMKYEAVQPGEVTLGLHSTAPCAVLRGLRYDALVFAAGAWTGALIRELQGSERGAALLHDHFIDSFPAQQRLVHWIVFKGKDCLAFNDAPSALFYSDGNNTEQDFYSRRNGIYTSGNSIERVHVSTDYPEDQAACTSLLPDSISGDSILERGAGFVPFCGYDGHPLVGRLPINQQRHGGPLYLSAGHGVWGITNSLGSADVLSDLILFDYIGDPKALPERSRNILQQLEPARTIVSDEELHYIRIPGPAGES